jgi:hypothetical protein
MTDFFLQVSGLSLEDFFLSFETLFRSFQMHQLLLKEHYLSLEAIDSLMVALLTFPVMLQHLREIRNSLFCSVDCAIRPINPGLRRGFTLLRGQFLSFVHGRGQFLSSLHGFNMCCLIELSCWGVLIQVLCSVLCFLRVVVVVDCRTTGLWYVKLKQSIFKGQATGMLIRLVR